MVEVVIKNIYIIMYLAVSMGNAYQERPEMQPGNLSHAHWLTTANHILVLYKKTNYNSTGGTKNGWFMMNALRYLPKNILKIIDPVIETYAYFGHVENV